MRGGCIAWFGAVDNTRYRNGRRSGLANRRHPARRLRVASAVSDGRVGAVPRSIRRRASRCIQKTIARGRDLNDALGSRDPAATSRAAALASHFRQAFDPAFGTSAFIVHSAYANTERTAAEPRAGCVSPARPLPGGGAGLGKPARYEVMRALVHGSVAAAGNVRADCHAARGRMGIGPKSIPARRPDRTFSSAAARLDESRMWAPRGGDGRAVISERNAAACRQTAPRRSARRKGTRWPAAEKRRRKTRSDARSARLPVCAPLPSIVSLASAQKRRTRERRAPASQNENESASLGRTWMGNS